MIIGTLTHEIGANGAFLFGHIQLEGDRLGLVLTESRTEGLTEDRTEGRTSDPTNDRTATPQKPAYRVHVVCDCCGTPDRVGAAWWKQARKHGGRFLLIVLNEGGMSRRFTLIAKPDGKGGFVVEPRRQRAQPARKKAA